MMLLTFIIINNINIPDDLKIKYNLFKSYILYIFEYIFFIISHIKCIICIKVFIFNNSNNNFYLYINIFDYNNIIIYI